MKKFSVFLQMYRCLLMKSEKDMAEFIGITKALYSFCESGELDHFFQRMYAWLLDSNEIADCYIAFYDNK